MKSHAKLLPALDLVYRVLGQTVRAARSPSAMRLLRGAAVKFTGNAGSADEIAQLLPEDDVELRTRDRFAGMVYGVGTFVEMNLSARAMLEDRRLESSRGEPSGRSGFDDDEDDDEDDDDDDDDRDSQDDEYTDESRNGCQDDDCAGDSYGRRSPAFDAAAGFPDGEDRVIVGEDSSGGRIMVPLADPAGGLSYTGPDSSLDLSCPKFPLHLSFFPAVASLADDAVPAARLFLGQDTVSTIGTIPQCIDRYAQMRGLSAEHAVADPGFWPWYLKESARLTTVVLRDDDEIRAAAQELAALLENG